MSDTSHGAKAHTTEHGATEHGAKAHCTQAGGAKTGANGAKVLDQQATKTAAELSGHGHKAQAAAPGEMDVKRQMAEIARLTKEQTSYKSVSETSNSNLKLNKRSAADMATLFQGKPGGRALKQGNQPAAARIAPVHHLARRSQEPAKAQKGNPYLGAKQTTLAAPLRLEGVGVHSGAPVSMTLYPAEANSGISFSVAGEGGDVDIQAHHDFVDNVMLCTVLSSNCGAAVATVEHLMAALRGLSIDNVQIMIDNGEVPIMDGSAMPFVRAIDEVGVAELDRPRRFIKVLKPVHVEDQGCWGELLPYNGFRLDVEIDFQTPLIGRQKFVSDLNPGIFREELAKARTFGFLSDVKSLWAAGRALGASLDNTVAIDDDRVVNAEGLRFDDEFVRHKALDAVGDLALAGYPLLCSYRSYRGGHALNAKVLEALFADDEAWTFVDAPQSAIAGKDRVEKVSEQVSGAALMTAANFAADRN